ncbi:ArsR family transcriptional regulator [Desulfonema ishimotonii]|uniref:ArsR family transcriptional regulator n=1 Tax=Desulfonema ishimotonii TaxID=45657 RepID=A0A401FXC6_9BACT|nr:metalloregulator ArsR/SmtB family transcription factor [Desulfonema ishimotonii]GBC61620.1 ArsR family transcriptional regulator [Desulfonema ishimotonii]
MEENIIKKEVKSNLAELFRIMGDNSRLSVLLCLSERSRNVSEIVRELGLKQSLVSHHLKVLRQYGLISAQRKSPFILYSASETKLWQLISLAMEVVEQARSELNSEKGGQDV